MSNRIGALSSHSVGFGRVYPHCSVDGMTCFESFPTGFGRVARALGEHPYHIFLPGLSKPKDDAG